MFSRPPRLPRGRTLPADATICPSTHPSLLARVAAAHAGAWGEFYTRYRGIVLRWSRGRGLTDADAEDLLQTFMADAPRKLRAYDLVDVFGQPNRFRSWLKTVVDRKAIDQCRRAARRTADHAPGGGLPAEIEDPDAAAALADELVAAYRHDVEAAVAAVRARVKPDTWDAYERCELRDEPAKAVAEALGKTVGAVYVAVHRVNALLAETGALLFGAEPNGPGTVANDEPLPHHR